MKSVLEVLMYATDKNNEVIQNGIKGEELGKLKLAYGSFSPFWYKGQHLYFVSNEEINKGDWFFNAYGDLLFCDLDEWAVQLNDKTTLNKGESRKKVVATTDKTLELVYITDTFVQYYIEHNGNIKEVEVTGWYVEIENSKTVKYMHVPLIDPIAEDMPTLKEKVLTLFEHLPVSNSRVPYTYHHDYLRSEFVKYSGMSRSEVGQATEACSEDSLYGLCFLGAVKEMDEFTIVYLETPELRELFYSVTVEARKIVQTGV